MHFRHTYGRQHIRRKVSGKLDEENWEDEEIFRFSRLSFLWVFSFFFFPTSTRFSEKIVFFSWKENMLLRVLITRPSENVRIWLKYLNDFILLLSINSLSISMIVCVFSSRSSIVFSNRNYGILMLFEVEFFRFMVDCPWEKKRRRSKCVKWWKSFPFLSSASPLEMVQCWWGILSHTELWHYSEL